MGIAHHAARAAAAVALAAGLGVAAGLTLLPATAGATGGGAPASVGMSCPNIPVTTSPELDPNLGSPPLRPVSTTCRFSTAHVVVLLNGDGRVHVPLNDGSAVTLSLYGQVVDVDPTAVEFPLCASCGVTSITDGTDTAVFTYDVAGQVTELLDTGPGTAPGGNTVDFSYDQDGNLVALNGDGVSLTITYDAADRRVASVNDGGTTYDYSYDARGDLTSAGPAGSPTTLTYDADGHLIAWGAPAGPATATLTYDADGDLTGFGGAGGTASYAYDADGNLTTVTDSNGTASYTYDATTGLLDDELINHLQEQEGIYYFYDHNGHGHRLISSSSGVPGGTLTPLHQYSYDADGNLLSDSNSDGASTTYTYDSDGRVTSVAVSGGGPTVTINWGDEDGGLVLTTGGVLACGSSAPGLVPPSCGAGLSGGILRGLGGRLALGGNVVDPPLLTLGGTPVSGGGGGVGIGGGATLGGGLFNGGGLGGAGFGGGLLQGDGQLAGSPGSAAGMGSGGGQFGGGLFPGGGFGPGSGEQGGQLNVGGVLTLGGSPVVLIGLPWIGNLSCWSCDPIGGGGILLTDNGAVTLYDAEGNVVPTGSEVPASVTGAGGATLVTFTYDADNRLTSVGDPAGDRYTFAYDSGGRLDQVTDPLGHITQYSYDADNRLVSETPPDGGTATFSYDATSGDLSQVTMPPYPGDQAGTTRFTYDQNGSNYDLTEVTDPLGRVTTYHYDAMDRQVSTRDNLGNLTTYSYDAPGSIDSVTDPDGTRTATYAYDADGQVISVTDPLGHTVTYSYDALDRMTGVTDALAPPDTTTYDYSGNSTDPSAVTDPLGHTVRYSYDAAGALGAITAPSGLQVTYTYDPGPVPPVLPEAPLSVLLVLVAVVAVGGTVLWRRRSSGAAEGARA